MVVALFFKKKKLGLNVIAVLILLQQQVINCVSFNEHLKFSIVVYD
jgi:hypothetical protein